MRSSGGTNFGFALSMVVACTNATSACLAGPSVHDGSAPPGGTVCADAETEKSGANHAGSTANVESRARRLTPKEGMLGFMFRPFQLCF